MADFDIDALDAPLSIILDHAKACGADAADAVAIYGRSAAIAVRGGQLEDIDNSEGSDIGLRVLIGQKQSSVSTSDLSLPSLKRVAERAVAMAKVAPDDPYCGLAPEEKLSERRDAEGLELHDRTNITPNELKDRAMALEAAALSVDGVRQAEGAQASASLSAVRFRTTHGFDGGFLTSRHGLSVSALAAQDGRMERDYDSQNTRWLSDLRSPAEVGERAGRQAVARLGSTSLPSGAMPVIFDRRVSSALIGALISAISGNAIARGVSFLKDDLGAQLFRETVQITEEPMRKRGLSTRPFDGEGVASREFDIIKNGKLTSWLLNHATAQQLGLETTGHAVRGLSGAPGIGTSNVTMAAGTLSRDDLIRETGTGLLILEMFGPSLNATTGDYSVGVSGCAIKGGELAGPVSEITVAGNLRNLYASLTPASDLILDYDINAPSVRVEGLTVAGR